MDLFWGIPASLSSPSSPDFRSYMHGKLEALCPLQEQGREVGVWVGSSAWAADILVAKGWVEGGLRLLVDDELFHVFDV